MPRSGKPAQCALQTVVLAHQKPQPPVLEAVEEEEEEEVGEVHQPLPRLPVQMLKSPLVDHLFTEMLNQVRAT